DLLDHLVVVVLGRNELGAVEDGEQLGIVDAEDRRLQPAREACSEGLVDVAARNPVVVGIGGRLPDDRYRLGVDLAALELLLPAQMVEHAGLVGARLPQLNRAAVVARVANAREGLLGVFAKRLADKMLWKQAA